MTRTYRHQPGVEIAGVLYLRAADLARLLTSMEVYGEVTSCQLDAWISRRDRNGFPEPPPIVYQRGPTGGIRGRLWDPEDVQDVLDWRATYQPQRGGAPRGERNGRWRHGQRRAIADDGTRLRSA
jgi:hypothetical protein